MDWHLTLSDSGGGGLHGGRTFELEEMFKRDEHTQAGSHKGMGDTETRYKGQIFPYLIYFIFKLFLQGDESDYWSMVGMFHGSAWLSVLFRKLYSC